MLPLAHIGVKLTLEGKSYEIEGFKIEFSQPIDYKKQPQHEIRGGQMMFTLSQIADDNLFLWAKTPSMLKNGSVLFRTDLGMTVLEITFSKAYCIQMIRETAINAGTKTVLVISPEIVSLNGIEHTNRWAK